MPRTEEIPRPPETGPSIPAGTARLGPACAASGDLDAKEDLVVQGVFKGNLRLPAHTLYIDRQADIQGQVTAAQVVLFGKLTGDVHTPGRIFIASEAKMKGDIVAGRVSIQDGAQFRGSIKIEPAA